MILQSSFEAIMKAERQEFNQMRDTVSNGYRPRKVFGQGRLMELQVPRTRTGQFYPLLLSIIKDQEEECRKLAFSLYGAGLTTEQVGELFEQLYGRNYSKSSISSMFDFAREEVELWLKRELDNDYPIIYIDATFIPVRRVESVSKEAFYTILGVTKDRTREVLSVVNLPTESAGGWKQALEQLKQRGVEKIGLVVSDALNAIEDAIAAVYPGTRHQLCVVHLERNLINEVKKSDKPKIIEEMKQIFRTSDQYYTPQKAWSDWKCFLEQWGVKYASIKRRQGNERYRHYFTYLQFDSRIQNMIYTTNWIERLNRDYKRVTRMRGALPDIASVILLLGNVAMTRKAYQRKIPKLDYDGSLFGENTPSSERGVPLRSTPLSEDANHQEDINEMK